MKMKRAAARPPGTGSVMVQRGRTCAWALLGGAALCMGGPRSGLAQSPVPYCLSKCDSTCSFNKQGFYSQQGCVSACMRSCTGPSGQGEQELYGSVYVGPDGSYGYGNKYSNQFDAMARAEKECREQSASQCKRLLVFVNRCAAVVQARHGDEVVGVTGAAEPRQADADAEALGFCHRNDPGADCVIAQRFCSDSP